ncbi:type II toxin-antitoxin system ParD family antitoxin [Acetobacter conturbans]|uniref:Type II toxin-antitoxin system ParD family antitoxin n=1 Tax=Acetobacter conturbans TaxID=1737472 RepID=A0ABX0K2T9_9PROT|nr:type II toxin-antitoxin system ParD family antitoxin [Acetobacter conturbans]NHN89449.1 type II toxin-antitoxin system ParD family antitoxin [Acetobacter conturbans]
MAMITISLPDPMKEWVEEQVRTGRYSNTSEYIRDLIQRDQDEQAMHKQIQAHITAGLCSGVSTRDMEQTLDEARAAAGTTATNI